MSSATVDQRSSPSGTPRRTSSCCPCSASGTIAVRSAACRPARAATAAASRSGVVGADNCTASPMWWVTPGVPCCSARSSRTTSRVAGWRTSSGASRSASVPSVPPGPASPAPAISRSAMLSTLAPLNIEATGSVCPKSDSTRPRICMAITESRPWPTSDAATSSSAVSNPMVRANR